MIVACDEVVRSFWVYSLFHGVIDHKDDYQQLERALELSREIAKDVDEQVQMHEREMLLIETYDKIDSKSSTTLKGESTVYDKYHFNLQS